MLPEPYDKIQNRLDAWHQSAPDQQDGHEYEGSFVKSWDELGQEILDFYQQGSETQSGLVRALVILTNLCYAAAGIVILFLDQTMLHASVAIALGLLTGGSWRFHETLKREDLTLDHLGMMFVGATLAGFALEAAFHGDPLYWLIGEVVVVGIFAMFIVNVDTNKWTAIFAALALLGVFLDAGWWALLPGGLFGVAVFVRLILDPGDTTWGHAVWHVLMAIAVTSTVWVVVSY